MTRGLVIGKFMPLHLGHIKLIRFAAEKCRGVTVLLCTRKEEPIPGPVRLGWLWETFRDDPGIDIAYTDRELPDSTSSSREMARVWASYLSVRFPEARIIVSSEDYGESLAEYMGIDHIAFDPERRDVPISASMIRMSPYEYWDFLAPPARIWYLRTICVCLPEDTGRADLIGRLAQRFRTAFVPDSARLVVDASGGVLTYGHIGRIARDHADVILAAKANASRFLFADTDIESLGMYSLRHFGKVPDFPPWVTSASLFDLYLLCDIDVPGVGHPARGSTTSGIEFARNLEDLLARKNAEYAILRGRQETLYAQAVKIIETRFGIPGGMFKG